MKDFPKKQNKLSLPASTMSKDQDRTESGPLVRVKADATGVDLSIGRAVPELFARLMPSRLRIRKAVDLAIGDRIVEKIRAGASLDQNEADFAAEVFSEAAKKFAKLGAVTQRAEELKDEGYRSTLLEAAAPSEPAAEARTTSGDWVTKFREDASLVDDDLVREIYARILAEESQQPRTFSLRTLEVLRYMDRDVATAFGWLHQVLINGNMVPDQSVARDNVLGVAGLDHDTMLMLDDAGLVNAGTLSQYSFIGNHVLAFPGLGRLVTITNGEGAPPIPRTTIRVHFLTPAGRQLATIADCAPADIIFEAMMVWLRSHFDESQIMLHSGKIESSDWKRHLPIAGLETVWDGTASGN